jgi:hypothetical protein
MIDIDDMAEICEKCINYYRAESSQDEDGCILKKPLSNCPQLIKIYILPDNWRKRVTTYDPLDKKNYYIPHDEDIRNKCADELDNIFKVKK